MANEKFQAKLDLPKSVPLGSKIPGVFTLTNLTKSAQQVLIWHTPLEGMFSPYCLKVTHAGKDIAYDGFVAIRTPSPQNDDYITVPAGGSVSADFELTDEFFIESLGTYEVEANCRIITLGAADGDAETVKSKTSFEVLDGEGFPLLTKKMKHEVSEQLTDVAAEDTSTPQAPTITGGTADQIAAIKQAWSNAYIFQNRCIQDLPGTSFDSTFTQTFQVPASSANKTTTSGYYTNMKTKMGNTTFTHVINAQQIGPGIAYTYLDTTTIWFNPSYFTFGPLKGDFSQAAIMVHELSHAVCSAPECSKALFCSYNIGYFSSRTFMEYSLTLPMGTIKVREGIFNGSETTVQWAPCNPNQMGRWLDGDELHVVCTFNLNPPIQPLPNAGEYAGLCVGACSDTDQTAITTLVNEAKRLYVPNKGQLLGDGSGNQITTGSTPGNGNIFYNAKSTTGDFTLTPSSGGAYCEK